MNSTRLFKPGDRVQKKTGGPVLTVQRYINEYSPWVGWHKSKNTLECSYWHSRKGYQKTVVHQNNLIKLSRGRGANYRQDSSLAQALNQASNNL